MPTPGGKSACATITCRSSPFQHFSALTTASFILLYPLKTMHFRESRFFSIVWKPSVLSSCPASAQIILPELTISHPNLFKPALLSCPLQSSSDSTPFLIIAPKYYMYLFSIFWFISNSIANFSPLVKLILQFMRNHIFLISGSTPATSITPSWIKWNEFAYDFFSWKFHQETTSSERKPV